MRPIDDMAWGMGGGLSSGQWAKRLRSSTFQEAYSPSCTVNGSDSGVTGSNSHVSKSDGFWDLAS